MNSKNLKNNQIKSDVFLASLYEYLLVILPVGLYVLLESIHKDDLSYLITSPEWAIASMFLSFIAFREYITSIRKSKRNAREPFLKLMSIISLLMTSTALVTTIFSIFYDNIFLVVFRVLFFILLSIIFLSIVVSATLIK